MTGPRYRKGDLDPKSNTTAAEVQKIRRLHSEGVDPKRIAERLGRSAPYVRRVIEGKIHKDV